MKFGQYAPNGCEVTILSNDWNESYCYRCISTFQLFKYPQKLDNTNCAIVTIVAFVTINANGAIVIIVVPPLSLMDHHDGN